MNSFFSLKNKIVLITGGSGYIGRYVVKSLISEGCKIILILRNRKSINKIKAIIGKKNVSVFFANVNIEQELDKALFEIERKFTKVDGIINMTSDNSGLGDIRYKNNYGKFTKAFNNNLFAPIKILLKLKNLLIKNKTKQNLASVINVSSIYGNLSPDQSIYKNGRFVNPIDYGCSKASQIQMSKYLANDKNFKNIRFNNIILGPIPNQNKSFNNQIFKKKLIEKIPIGRFGKPSDIIGVIILLLSSESSFITGSSITIDGGWSSK